MPESTPVAVHHQIPMHNVEDWMYEDFQIGDKRRSIARTISEGEAMMFNAMVLDMHPYVADQPFAESEGNFGKRLVAGAQVFSYGLGLMANNNVHTFSYGYDKLRFIKPVFIGDTIYTIRTHLSKRPKYESMGLVVVSYEIFKTSGDGVSGDLVLYAEHLQTVKYRDPSQWTDQIEK
ncbi:MaoC family dehydratase [Crateriforma conspicua]|uniref:MaoC family dehydratase n=1 Tax=Crateriforma conspicua TaxID=2527996 RepID=UPI0011A975FB|nr:MaoC family dehydratase [Crateriforma conspicua]